MPLLLAAFGLICIVVGYRLFCGLPARQYPRATVLVLNILPGALLALFGAGLFTTQARAMFAHRPATHRAAPSEQDTAWPSQVHRIPDHSV
jgi:hypothetical protein